MWWKRRQQKPVTRIVVHADPHMNVHGGCDCTCIRCVGWMRRESQTFNVIRWRKLCICDNCNDECVTDRLDGKFEYPRNHETYRV